MSEKQRKILIAGPCSAESPQQLMESARAIEPYAPDYFRAGIWKPRSRPGNFEGAGLEALNWLQEVKRTVGLPVITEVALPRHVDVILKAEIDAVWIGARTTVNPLYVSEIVNALKGTEIPVFIKNPISPDLPLWIGAAERFLNTGLDNIAMIHRGFSSETPSQYRNLPIWKYAWKMKNLFPNVPMLCDPSHMAGNVPLAKEIIEQCRDTIYDGFMLEVHPNPETALSDRNQQFLPSELKQMFPNRHPLESSESTRTASAIKPSYA